MMALQRRVDTNRKDINSNGQNDNREAGRTSLRRTRDGDVRKMSTTSKKSFFSRPDSSSDKQTSRELSTDNGRSSKNYRINDSPSRTDTRISPAQEDTDEDKRDRGRSSWKQVIKKLETSQPTKNSMTKVIKSVDMEVKIDELQCKHFDTCGGCTVRGNFTNIPIINKARTFFASEGFKSFPIHIYNHWEWRTHVKLAVQPLSKWGGLKFGLYKTGTHEVEPIPDCRVHHPRINEAIEVLKAEASVLGVKGYSPGSDRIEPSGELRYVQLSVERASGKVQLVLVWNCMTFKEAEQTLPRLTKKLKGRYDLFDSITVNFHTSTGNSIFNYNPKSWKLLWGAPVLKEVIGEATFLFRPQIFRQVP
jgi:hypothetical protein